MDEEDADFEDSCTAAATPLSMVADSFEELSESVKVGGGSDYDLRLKPFCDACAHVSILFGCLGITFKFAEMEYTAKVIYFIMFVCVCVFYVHINWIDSTIYEMIYIICVCFD